MSDQEQKNQEQENNKPQQTRRGYNSPEELRAANIKWERLDNAIGEPIARLNNRAPKIYENALHIEEEIYKCQRRIDRALSKGRSPKLNWIMIFGFITLIAILAI